MLRVDKRAGFVTEGAWFWKTYRFRSGKFSAVQSISSRALEERETLQRDQPVPLIEADGRRWWWYRDGFYWEDDGLSAQDVMALVLDRERRMERKLDRAHAALHQEQTASRAGSRSRARCAWPCGSETADGAWTAAGGSTCSTTT